MKGNQRWNRDEEAVSEVVGSALLVGLTVVAVSVFGLVATQAFNPIKRINADLSPQLSPGPDGAWGGLIADDELTLRHLGGAALDRAATAIRVTTPGGTTTYREAALGTVFDGGFVIGERWALAGSFPGAPTCTPVQIQVLLDHGFEGSQLLLHETLIANEGACP